MWKVTCIWKSGSVTTLFYLEEWRARIARIDISRNRGVRKTELFRIDWNQE